MVSSWAAALPAGSHKCDCMSETERHASEEHLEREGGDSGRNPGHRHHSLCWPLLRPVKIPLASLPPCSVSPSAAGLQIWSCGYFLLRLCFVSLFPLLCSVITSLFDFCSLSPWSALLRASASLSYLLPSVVCCALLCWWCSLLCCSLL